MDGVIVDFGHQIDIINKDPKISKEYKSSPDLIGLWFDLSQLLGCIFSDVEYTKRSPEGRFV